ncbi:MAG: alanine racemase [Bacteroidales bacterium]
MRLTKPTLLTDKEKCLQNIRKMTDKAKKHNLSFRPHFKTHQSADIGRWFIPRGIDKITVSSVDMAFYFARDGWKDITIAFPLNINEIDRINLLAREHTIHLTLLNMHGIEALNEGLKYEAGIFLEIDTGSKRTGISYENIGEIFQLKEKIDASPKLRLEGMLTHSGHTYQAGSREEIMGIHQETKDRLSWIKKQMAQQNDTLHISVGDTPSCTLADDFSNIDEIRPGNFVFYDLQQYNLNICTLDEIAVCMACPVVAKYKERNEIVVHGGAVHFSKDSFPEENRSIYGYGVILTDKGWIIPEEKIILKKLSQEHGTLYADSSMLKKFDIGDFIGILPVHSCLTADAMGSYREVATGRSYDHMKK